jgi:hypothetical protein
MSAVNFTATRGLSLLGDEVGAWMADTTAETLVGSDLVTNGDFATDTDWTKGTGWTIAAGVATHVAGVGSDLTQAISVEIGKAYIIEFDVTAITTSHDLYVVGASNYELMTSSPSAGNSYSHTFIAASTTIGIRGSSIFDGSIDNIKLRLAIPDLSTADNGLGVHGSIVKSAVATGADLVGYSDFSALNYIEQPYNSDFAPGIGAWFYEGWALFSANTVIESIMTRGNTSLSGSVITLILAGDGTLQLNVSDDGLFTSDSVISTIAVDDGIGHHIAIAGDGTNFYLYIDGALNNSTAISNAAASLDNATATLRFGYRQDSSQPLLSGKLALWRGGAVSRTAAQIKSIYDKEKHLFKKNSYYTQEGVAYDLDIKQMSPRPSNRTQKSTTTTISGKKRSIVHREEREWQINTSVIHRTDGTTYLRRSEFEELMFSTNGSEIFTYDPYGSVATPDEPLSVQRTNNQYSLTPEENTEYYRASFTAQEVVD